MTKKVNPFSFMMPVLLIIGSILPWLFDDWLAYDYMFIPFTLAFIGGIISVILIKKFKINIYLMIGYQILFIVLSILSLYPMFYALLYQLIIIIMAFPVIIMIASVITYKHKSQSVIEFIILLLCNPQIYYAIFVLKLLVV